MVNIASLVQDALAKGDAQAYVIAARIRRESVLSATEGQVCSALQRLRKSGVCRFAGSRWELVAVKPTA